MNTTFKTITTLAAGSVAALTVVGNAQAANLVISDIDSFEDTQVVGNPAGSSTIGPDVASITSSFLGGSVTRTVTGTITGGSSTAANAVLVDIDDSLPGSFSVSNAVNRESEINVAYGFTGPIDFTSGGATDRLLLDVQANDLPMDLIFNFTDSDGTIGSISFVSPGNIPPDAAGLLPGLFDDVVASGGDGTLDFDSITAFSFDVNTQAGVPAADITFDVLAVGTESTSVPEPGTIFGLVAFGVAGLAGRRLKK